MARVFIEGFESGGYDLCDGSNSLSVISSTGYDMDGSYCLNMNAFTEYYYKDVSAANEYYVSVLWRTSNINGRGIMSVWNGSTVLCAVYRSGADIRASRGTTQVATADAGLANNNTYRIEAYFRIHDTTGRIQVKVDGVEYIDFTGDTKPGADTTIDRIQIGCVGSSSTFWAHGQCDNFIIDDSEFPGDTEIRALAPGGAGAATQWTPSAGSNYACVDEIPVSDADYVSVDAVNQVDTYAMGNMAAGNKIIKCVQVQARMNKDGTPTPQNFNLAVRSGGTNYFSADKAVPAAYASLCHLWITNPADSAAWEKADVDAMEAGVRSRT